MISDEVYRAALDDFVAAGGEITPLICCVLLFDRTARLTLKRCSAIRSLGECLCKVFKIEFDSVFQTLEEDLQGKGEGGGKEKITPNCQ